MIILLSPAKTLDVGNATYLVFTEPQMLTEAMSLVRTLKKFSVTELKDLMSISDKLAVENHKRFKQLKRNHSLSNAKQALWAFQGDVYRGLDAENFNEKDIAFAQEHLRILSGLYGILRPLDLMQAYRLEMGTTLKTAKGNNLYDYWGTKITKYINRDLNDIEGKVIVNLASQEYFKSIKVKSLKAPVLEINFKEFRGDKLTFVSFNAKKARGMMARYIIKNKIDTIEGIKGFDMDGYAYSEEHSSDDSWLFVR